MTDRIGWGILSTGKIARTVAADLALVPDARLVAVGSRTQQAADRFAHEFESAQQVDAGTVRAHGIAEALVADPEVEVVYLAGPHSVHLEHALLAMAAGKHVLCEKPLTVTVADAEAMVAAAREHGVFLMEAMWTATHPVVRTLVAGVHDGRWGTPRHLHAELGMRVDAGPDHRLLDPALGASALLDMGIYPLTIAHLLLGEAASLRAVGSLSERGIDLDVAVVGRYAGGAVATMTASVTSWSSRRLAIATDRGRIDVHDFHHPTLARFTPIGEDGAGEAEPILGSAAVIGRGYGNEIAEVNRCVRAGLLESPLVPHAQTLTLMRQLEDLLRQVGSQPG